MEQLKEHRQFRNQLIVVSLILLAGGYFFEVPEGWAFGIIFGLIAIYNIFTYRENVRDYKKLQKLKGE